MTSLEAQARVCPASEEEHEQEEDTYAGRASGLYPRL